MNKIKPLLIIICLLSSAVFMAYPIDGYRYTGIDRLMYHYRNFIDSTRQDNLRPGAHLLMDDIKLSLWGYDVNIPEEDEELSRKVNRLFTRLEPPYSISVMDITDPANLKYASRKDHVGYQPGSVGKLAVAIAIFDQMEDIYGDDWEEIRGVLYTKVVRSGVWGVPNHHTVPFYDVKNDRYWKRHVNENDVFTLYEWFDHMMSISSNAAASILMREAIIMHLTGKAYECLTEDEANQLIADTPRSVLTDIMHDVINCPLRELGISEDEWKLGGFFTRGAERYVGRKGGSIGTTRGLLKYMLALEQGKVVNPRSSLELKRLMYMTDRRIRYASAGAIRNDAVYFKSGSLYSFKPEPGFVKRKYAGNVYNYMNSIAIIEKQDSIGKKYMVALMSNVLRKNSVSEHYALAYQIDKLIHE